MEKRLILINRVSLDGVNERKKFKTLRGARKYLDKWYGDCSAVEGNQVVCVYGSQRAYVFGATFQEIFAEKEKEGAR